MYFLDLHQENKVKGFFNEDSRQSAYLLSLAYSKASAFRIPDRVWSNVQLHTSNLWGKCPLYGCNATDRLIYWEIHYQPL